VQKAPLYDGERDSASASASGQRPQTPPVLAASGRWADGLHGAKSEQLSPSRISAHVRAYERDYRRIPTGGYFTPTGRSVVSITSSSAY